MGKDEQMRAQPITESVAAVSDVSELRADIRRQLTERRRAVRAGNELARIETAILWGMLAQSYRAENSRPVRHGSRPTWGAR